MATSGTEAQNQDPSNAPLYHEIPPTIAFITRVVGFCALFMVVLAFIFCLVRGSQVNATFFLLACNIVISSFVGIVNAWWYRKGVLEADKYWYMWIVAGVIIFQCLATDIFVFNVGPRPKPPSTLPPHTTHNVTLHSLLDEFVTKSMY